MLAPLSETFVIGQYQIVGELGVGGMATVYEAEHLGLRKRVALKVLRSDFAGRSDQRARFLREGVAASRIRHPHIVDITDVGEDGELAYLVMELLEGEPLSAHLERQPRLLTAKAVDIILPILAALGEAHRAGVVHRDIKPENLFLARTAQGQLVPKLLDFGVSRMVSSSMARLTAQAEILGTPHYMSPEQARGEDRVGPASDQFSAAVVLFECLTGTLPHNSSQSLPAVLREVAFGNVIPPSKALPEIDPELERVLLRALSPAADTRYPDVEAFGQALAPFASRRGRSSFAALIGADELELAAPALLSGDHRLSLPEVTRLVAEVGSAKTLPAPRMERPSSDVPTVSFPPKAAVARVAPAPAESAPVITQSPPESAPAAPPVQRRSGLRTFGTMLVVLGVASVLVTLAALRLRWVDPQALGHLFVSSPQEGEASIPSDTEPVVPEAYEEVPEAPASPAAPEVSIRVVPAHAILELDGVPVGVGSYEGPAPEAGASHILTIHAPGYIRRQTTLLGPTARVIELSPE